MDIGIYRSKGEPCKIWCVVPNVLSQWVGFTSRLVANWTNQFTNQAQEINLADAIKQTTVIFTLCILLYLSDEKHFRHRVDENFLFSG